MQTPATVASHHAIPAPTAHQQALAGRGIGAQVTAVFGAIWMTSGLLALAGPSISLLLAIGACTAGLIIAAIRLAPRLRKPSKDQAECLEGGRLNARFQRINALQWAAIVALIVTLNVLHQPQWILAGIILIVGLHFLPLARLFHTKSHLIVGLALAGWALVYPFALSDPSSPWGALGAGAILWMFSGSMIAVLVRSRR